MVKYAVTKITKIHFWSFLHFCKGGTREKQFKPAYSEKCLLKKCGILNEIFMSFYKNLRISLKRKKTGENLQNGGGMP